MDDLPALDIVEDIETIMQDDEIEDVEKQLPVKPEQKAVPLTEEPILPEREIIFVKPVKKKPLSEKQKAHTEKLKMMNRARAKKMKELEKKEKEEAQTRSEPEQVIKVKEQSKSNNEEDEFGRFMKHYEKMSLMRHNYEMEKSKKAEAKRKEEEKIKKLAENKRKQSLNILKPPVAHPYDDYFG